MASTVTGQSGRTVKSSGRLRLHLRDVVAEGVEDLSEDLGMYLGLVLMASRKLARSL